MHFHACTWSDCEEINENLFESMRHFRVVASTQSARPEGVPVVNIGQYIDFIRFCGAPILPPEHYRDTFGSYFRVVPTTRKWRIDSNKLSLISLQSDQVQACKYIHLMSNFIKNNSIVSILAEMP